MGGDNSPGIILEGLSIALNNFDNFSVILYGDKDKIVSSDIKNFMKILEPTSVIKVLPDSSHIPFLTNPDDFLETIKEFI